MRRVHTTTGRKVATIRRVLRSGGATVYGAERVRGPRYTKADDRMATAQIRDAIRTRPTYGARRMHVLVNRRFRTTYNLERIRRVMDVARGKLPRYPRCRTGRAHTGQIHRTVSNER
ncbi:MAG TPA: IS3 family transposase [Gemmatimonadaceae bacterium]|nr:IS3 family transposase [Gemmatimonadaceae bacterium]